MALLLPKRFLGPILTLSLPKYEKAVNLVVTNVTTGKSMTIEVPALAAALEVVLDFSAKTAIDSEGVSRSAWISATDDGLWVANPLIEGSNDVQVEAFEAAEGEGIVTPWAQPAVVENDKSIGSVAWKEPGNAKVEDGKGAVFYSIPEFNIVSNYLKALDFGLGVPVGATPKGIKFQVRLRNLGVGEPEGYPVDKAIRAVKNGVIGESDRSKPEEWPSGSFVTRSYGGAADLFGTAWAVAQLTASNFGLAFSLEDDVPGFGETYIEIDSIKAAVVYDYLPMATTYGATAEVSWRQSYV